MRAHLLVRCTISIGIASLTWAAPRTRSRPSAGSTMSGQVSFGRRGRRKLEAGVGNRAAMTVWVTPRAEARDRRIVLTPISSRYGVGVDKTTSSMDRLTIGLQFRGWIGARASARAGARARAGAWARARARARTRASTGARARASTGARARAGTTATLRLRLRLCFRNGVVEGKEWHRLLRVSVGAGSLAGWRASDVDGMGRGTGTVGVAAKLHTRGAGH